MCSMSALAPAKINLTLEILGRRPDGFHNILSFIQTLDLSDRMQFEPASELTLEVRGDPIPGKVDQESNLVLRAARLLQERTHCNQGARILLEKMVPAGAGLGGGSSDAATTLLALDTLWSTGIGHDELARLAAKLGSDVPFFLTDGAAIVSGRGDVVLPVESTAQFQFLLVVPGHRRTEKTAFAYSRVTSALFTQGTATQRLRQAMKEGNGVGPKLLFNAFDALVDELYPEIAGSWRFCKEAGLEPHLAGSGPAFVVWPRTPDETAKVEQAITKQFGHRAIRVSTRCRVEREWS